MLVKPTGRKSWVFRFRDPVHRRYQDHGLGSCDVVSLKQARDEAEELRSGLRKRLNPIDEKNNALQAAQDARAAKDGELTFWHCAEQCIALKAKKWRNDKHTKQWASTLLVYCSEWKDRPISEIDADMVEAALLPRWGSETSRRVQQRIAAVFDWAISREKYIRANPARWKGHMETRLGLPKRKVTHRPAVPYGEMKAFMVSLDAKTALSAKALKLQILTATRPGEAIGAKWSEFDIAKKRWTIPADRMKAEVEHVVPLSPQVLNLLDAIPRTTSDYLFPGVRGRAMTTDAMLKTLQTICPDETSHGFRSSFSDWAAETTDEPIVTEAALAHTISDAVVAAYRRTNLFDKRATLMTRWAEYCCTK